MCIDTLKKNNNHPHLKEKNILKLTWQLCLMLISDKLLHNLVKSHKTHHSTDKIRKLNGNTFKTHKTYLGPVRLENINCETVDAW